jgi:transposase
LSELGVPTLKRDIRAELSAPLVADLEALCAGGVIQALSPGSDVAKAMDYLLKRGPAFTRFLHDGRVCLSNTAAEAAFGLALGRSQDSSPAPIAAASAPPPMYKPFVTAKMNDIDPPRFGAPMFSPASRPSSLTPLLPWNGRLATASLSREA